VIADLLPASIAVEEVVGEFAAGATDDDLHPEERAAIAKAVDSRRAEFAAVRRCARTALTRIGVTPGPILPGGHREPVWPDGVVGSMTHTEGYGAAAVALATEFTTIGVDAEPNLPLPDGGILTDIALPDEQARLADLAAAHPDIAWDRLLFSAKESVYKAWFPLTRRWLDFLEADVTIEADAGRFTARLRVPGPEVGDVPLAGFDGRWRIVDGLILTAIAVPA